ncbi:hypothetical protein G6F57_023148 [Rhizopus arrhizus]|nr:hypothetical protein G6F57_023148 [Rhizopus arrhizus]
MEAHGAVLAVRRRAAVRPPAVRPHPAPPADGKADPVARRGLGQAEPGLGRLLPHRGRAEPVSSRPSA